ncbi:MAG: glutamine--fructose-6-phosphate transaminase (isomerizing), partial [Oscillospiraceae bacterium]|nr:glutamine--fructose-6-phosphate transaminase (isomerizing) [Oscillospiraceae bacterium]
LIAARKDGPLIIAHEPGESYLASDVTAILKYTRSVSYLDDGEIAVLRPDGIAVYDAYGMPIEKEVTHIEWDADAAQKGGYAHYMLKEIHEQPKVCRDTVSPRIRGGAVDLSDAGIGADYFDDVKSIIIIGCGSAYHTGVAGKYWLEKHTRIPTQYVLASEFRYADPILDESTLIVVMSQSGETLDTIAALREARRSGAKTLAIVNVHGSTITREAEHTLYIHAGPEISVATTKAYTAMLAALVLITLAIAARRGTMPDDAAAIAALLALPDKIDAILQTVEPLQYLAAQYFNHNSVFFIGRNLDYAAAMEAALKLKEISYIHAETYAGGELKHGTISLIEDGTPVIAFAAHAPLAAKLESNIIEVKSRGADTICVTQERLAPSFAKSANHLITVPDTHEMLTPILSALPLQLFAYYVALQRGCDVDQPRNLAKSVTVE